MAGSPENSASSSTSERLYTVAFFQTFAAVAIFMTAVALQFHFGQFIAYLGHETDTLGWVIGLSMAGTLIMRLHAGQWIDRFGCRAVWIAGTIVATLANGAVQFTTALWLITLLRACSTMATATVMTTVAVQAALLAPPNRRAESLGTIGLAGFVGMLIGPTCGDLIFSGDASSATPYHIFFTSSAVLCAVSGLLIARFGGNAHAAPRAAIPQGVLRTAVEHWPGAILLVGVVFGMAFCMQSLFLERLAEARAFYDIKVFFITYAPTAMILRIIFRRAPQALGRRPTLIGGLFVMAVGVGTLSLVHDEWHLILPGLLMGTGHCFVFPSMVDLAAERLPPERRGAGTALILGAQDVGMLVGFVVLGEAIATLGFNPALLMLGGTIAAGAIVFTLCGPPAARPVRDPANRLPR